MSQTITYGHTSIPNCESSEKTFTAGNNQWITQIIDFDLTLFRGQILPVIQWWCTVCIFNSNNKTVTFEIILVRLPN